MDKAQTQIRDADEAARILNSPLFEQAFDDVRQSYIKALEAVPTTSDGDDQAKDFRRQLKALEYVKGALRRRIDTGKLTQKELSLREKAARGVRGAVKSLYNHTGDR